MAPKLRSSKPRRSRQQARGDQPPLDPGSQRWQSRPLPAKIAVTSPRRPKVRPALTDSSKSSSGTMIGSGAVTPRSLSASRHPLVRVFIGRDLPGRPTWKHGARAEIQQMHGHPTAAIPFRPLMTWLFTVAEAATAPRTIRHIFGKCTFPVPAMRPRSYS